MLWVNKLKKHFLPLISLRFICNWVTFTVKSYICIRFPFIYRLPFNSYCFDYFISRCFRSTTVSTERQSATKLSGAPHAPSTPFIHMYACLFNRLNINMHNVSVQGDGSMGLWLTKCRLLFKKTPNVILTTNLYEHVNKTK